MVPEGRAVHRECLLNMCATHQCQRGLLFVRACCTGSGALPWQVRPACATPFWTARELLSLLQQVQQHQQGHCSECFQQRVHAGCCLCTHQAAPARGCVIPVLRIQQPLGIVVPAAAGCCCTVGGLRSETVDELVTLLLVVSARESCLCALTAQPIPGWPTFLPGKVCLCYSLWHSARMCAAGQQHQQGPCNDCSLQQMLPFANASSNSSKRQVCRARMRSCFTP